MKQYLIPFFIGVFAVVFCLVAFLIGKTDGYQRGYSDALNAPHKADTVFKTDTHFINNPVETIRWKEKEKLVRVAVTDTVYHHDTTFIMLPKEFKQYNGEEYSAQVSGIEPSLDWIKVFPKTAYVTNTVIEKRKWAFGATLGPAIVYDGKVHGGIGVAVGIGYNF